MSTDDILVNARTAAWRAASVELFYNAALAQPMFKISAGRKQAGQGKVIESCLMATCSDQLPSDPASWAMSPSKLIDLQLPVVEWEVAKGYVDSEGRSHDDAVLVRVPNASAARCEVVVGMSVLDRVLASAQGKELPASVHALFAHKDSAMCMLQAFSGSDVAATPVCKVRCVYDLVCRRLDHVLSLSCGCPRALCVAYFCVVVLIADNV